jgi:hypothetical protein
MVRCLMLAGLVCRNLTYLKVFVVFVGITSHFNFDRLCINEGDYEFYKYFFP